MQSGNVAVLKISADEVYSFWVRRRKAATIESN
jgi:hypothetical protein